MFRRGDRLIRRRNLGKFLGDLRTGLGHTLQRGGVLLTDCFWGEEVLFGGWNLNFGKFLGDLRTGLESTLLQGGVLSTDCFWGEEVLFGMRDNSLSVFRALLDDVDLADSLVSLDSVGRMRIS